MGKDTEYFESNRRVMTDFLPANYSKVLEIGCASGGFREHLNSALEYWGVEPNELAASHAASHLTKVLVGRYDQIEGSLPDHYFDLVVCNDVIEHMVDHVDFFINIKKKVKPGAYLVGSLPNIRHITALIKLLVLRDWPMRSLEYSIVRT
jgi:2-polyprenyl-3-methyl-5-hydroxy-6-metoxy-1,4-benzoquinol methylase